MNQPKPLHIRRTLRSRAVQLACVLTLAGSTVAAILLISGRTDLGLYASGATSSLLVLTGIVLLQRNATAALQSTRRRDEKLANLERIVSRAEWRNGQELERLLSRLEWRNGERSRQIQSEIREVDPSVRLGRVEASLHSIATRLAAANNSGPHDHRGSEERQPEISERDLEIFLAHLLSNGNSKGN